ncbi:hypothetical protein HMPREF1986_00902 [Oribacterium sp. oral taxon 078 str. F0263]|nr:hypothetical protein HMPREF1986_00902 [Oribacterium sp. oral taxon 078 str. F0263]
MCVLLYLIWSYCACSFFMWEIFKAGLDHAGVRQIEYSTSRPDIF